MKPDKGSNVTAQEAKDLEEAVYKEYLKHQTAIEEFYRAFGVSKATVKKWFTPGQGPKVLLKNGLKDNLDGWTLPFMRIRVNTNGRSLDRQASTAIHEMVHKTQIRAFGATPRGNVNVTPGGLVMAMEAMRVRNETVRREFIAYLAEAMMLGVIR